MNSLKVARVAIQKMGREQLETALEAAAFAGVQIYLKDNPLPAECTAEERAAVFNEMVGRALIGAINAAGLALKAESDKGAQEENAKDIAEAAIAKAAGKLQ